MLKSILILSVVAVFGVSVASAQQMPTTDCDPYRTEVTGFSIDASALKAAPTNAVEAAAVSHMGFNPQALVQLTDNVSGLDIEIADFANPQAQLVPNAFATVTEDGAALKLYTGTCVEAPVLAQFQPGTRVTVLDGPISAEGLAWWRVRLNDLTGWVIEGEDNEVWLQG
jgi:hypothetical protein